MFEGIIVADFYIYFYGVFNYNYNLFNIYIIYISVPTFQIKNNI